MQQQKNAFNRRHNDHFHDMTLSIPQQDTRAMNIPQNTIEPLGKRKFRLPFRYLRTWIFSLLSLVCLPIGIGLILAGADMQENLNEDWLEVTATIDRIDETFFEYSFNDANLGNGDGELGYDLDYFLDADIAGQLVWTVSVCDLVSPLIARQDEGSEFPMWVHPDKTSLHSCVPISQDFASLYMVAGFVLVILSAWRLIRTFHSAGMQPRK